MWPGQPEERLKLWKAFRESLATKDLHEVLSSVANKWADVPFVPYYLDMSDTQSWPDPWTLIHENRYCNLAKGLGMFYTLYYSHFIDKHSVTFSVYKDDIGYEYGLVIVDNEYILNHTDREIVNTQRIEQSLTLVKEFSKQDLKIE
jgi:hypothetical protein